MYLPLLRLFIFGGTWRSKFVVIPFCAVLFAVWSVLFFEIMNSCHSSKAVILSLLKHSYARSVFFYVEVVLLKLLTECKNKFIVRFRLMKSTPSRGTIRGRATQFLPNTWECKNERFICLTKFCYKNFSFRVRLLLGVFCFRFKSHEFWHLSKVRA